MNFDLGSGFPSLRQRLWAGSDSGASSVGRNTPDRPSFDQYCWLPRSLPAREARSARRVVRGRRRRERLAEVAKGP
ncbi:MAG: hypothetical protein [Olavius algarvensis Gamma 1 endosymbiont]|nr:MAG: hypothetical protein [Olavius algarvensis Gamma 1 endosymbiont]